MQAKLEPQRTESRMARIKQVLANRQATLHVAIENINDPHNVAAILRSCDAVGVQHVHMIYPSGLFPGIKKTIAKGAKEWVTIHRYTDLSEFQQVMQKNGLAIWLTSLTDSAQSIYECQWTTPVVLCLGNEQKGASSALHQIAHQHLTIPMMGMVKSLNVSVAAAVTLYEAMRQRSAYGMYGSSEFQLHQTEINQLYQEWLIV